MKNLILKAYLMILLIIYLVGTTAAQSDPLDAKDGGTYPVGTVLKAVCKPNLAHLKSTWTSFEVWNQKQADAGYDGWLKYTPSVNTRNCTGRFMTQGKYRMVVVSGRFDRWEEVEIRAQFTIGKLSPCEGKSNQIVAVRDGSGRKLDDGERDAMGLGNNRLMQGQVVRVPKNMPQGIEIEFYDYSIMRLTSGSQLKLDKCSDLDPQETPLKIKIGLLLGKIWAKITPDSSADYNIQTERAVCGNRGTVFSVEYNAATKTTMVVVEEGSVWLKNLFGKPQTIDIGAGKTGTQTLNRAPVLRKN